jgi:anti-sigma regulatory factor (Ser/Thr protein kinase)
VSQAFEPHRDARAEDVLDTAFDRSTLHHLRSLVAASAKRLGACHRQVRALVLIASELASNAIRHGGGRGRLRLWRQHTTLYCQVGDDGPGLSDPTAGTVPASSEAGHGRGLWMVRQLASSVAIMRCRGGSGTCVTVAVA